MQARGIEQLLLPEFGEHLCFVLKESRHNELIGQLLHCLSGELHPSASFEIGWLEFIAWTQFAQAGNANLLLVSMVDGSDIVDGVFDLASYGYLSTSLRKLQPLSLRKDAVVVDEFFAIDVELILAVLGKHLVAFHIPQQFHPVSLGHRKRRGRLGKFALRRLFDAELPKQRRGHSHPSLPFASGTNRAGPPDAWHATGKVDLHLHFQRPGRMEENNRPAADFNRPVMLRNIATMNLAIHKLRQLIPFAGQICIGHLRVGVDAKDAPFVNGKVLLDEFLGEREPGHKKHHHCQQ